MSKEKKDKPAEEKKIKAIFDSGVLIPVDTLDLENLDMVEVSLKTDIEKRSIPGKLVKEYQKQISEKLAHKLYEILRHNSRNMLGDKIIWRVKIENEIRKLKRSGLLCPFNKQNICNNPHIRCGERQQFSRREQDKDKKHKHKCNYKLSSTLSLHHILIVDDDSTVLDTCARYLETMGVDKKKIVRAGSTKEAVKVLREGKLKSITYCIVVSDVALAGDSGFDLVNHIIERNFNSRILLMSGSDLENKKPDHYLGDEEIVKGEKVVSGFLKKPFRFTDFSAYIKEIENSLMKIS